MNNYVVYYYYNVWIKDNTQYQKKNRSSYPVM